MEYREISIAVIDTDKNQPRKDFDLTELKESIRENGILIPIVVQPTSHGGWADYIIVDGERRFRAAKELGLKTVPAVVNYNRRKDRFRDQVIIDHQRQSLNAEEKSKGWLKLLEENNGNYETVAKSVGVSVTQVKNVIEGVRFKERVKDQLPDDMGWRERAIIRRTNKIKDDNLRAKLVINSIENNESNKLIDEKVKILSEKSVDGVKLSSAEQKIILNAKDIQEALISIQNMRREIDNTEKPKKTPKKSISAEKKKSTVKTQYNCLVCNGTLLMDTEEARDMAFSLFKNEMLVYYCTDCGSIFATNP